MSTNATWATRSTRVQALMKAAEIFGGLELLSLYLGVSPEDLRKWMAGDGEPPHATFMLAVDAILEEQ
jgi:hypothetical protein